MNYLEGKIGAIVMNCNPFTKGHRYLIEYASARVDTLIVFVVEEDASYFSFDDRFRMVQLGTADMLNVRVVPSGAYNISKSAFAQYFEKDARIEQVESMEYDIRIFCEVIAKAMHISCRFAGEEPTDVVTAAYNDTMRTILPQYGVEFCEIPRLKLENRDEVVSATKVRECLENGDWETLTYLLPESGYEYLKKISVQRN